MRLLILDIKCIRTGHYNRTNPLEGKSKAKEEEKEKYYYYAFRYAM